MPGLFFINMYLDCIVKQLWGPLSRFKVCSHVKKCHYLDKILQCIKTIVPHNRQILKVFSSHNVKS